MKKILQILNTRQGVISLDYKKESLKFLNIFANFTKLFEKFSFDESYLNKEEMEVTYAYYVFINYVATEVKHINSKKC